MKKMAIIFAAMTMASSVAYADRNESNHNENHVSYENGETRTGTSGSYESKETHNWNEWTKVAGVSRESGRENNRRGLATPAVPNNGSASYSGNTVAVVNDNGVRSVSTGLVDMEVNFTGNGQSTQTGLISGLTGTGGAKIGDLSFSGTGLNSKFRGSVTSATATTGTGSIEGNFSRVITPVGGITPTPDIVKGEWKFRSNPTLSVRGTFAAGKQ